MQLKTGGIIQKLVTHFPPFWRYKETVQSLVGQQMMFDWLDEVLGYQG